MTASQNHPKNTNEVTDAYLKDLLRRAKRYCKITNNPQIREDFSSYSVLRAIEMGKPVNLEWIWKDFVKIELGRSDVKKDGRAWSRSGKARSESISIPISKETLDVEAPPAEDPNYLLRVIDSLEISRDERSIFILRYKYDLELKDIGEILGFTDSRVCQLLKKTLLQVTTNRSWDC